MRNDLFLGMLLVTSIALPADASSWQQIPGYKTSYIDLASIRRDTFPRQYTNGITNGWVDGHRDVLTYTITWLSFGAEGAKSEVIYDCSGQMAVMQQVIPNETAASQYHSFDDTQSFRASGVPLSSIVPDSVYDKAQTLACGVFSKH